MTEETPRLILMTAPIIGADVPALVEKLAAAAEASDVASVVLRLAPGVDDKALAPLVRFAEEHNAALLLADDSSRAARLTASSLAERSARRKRVVALARRSPKRGSASTAASPSSRPG